MILALWAALLAPVPSAAAAPEMDWFDWMAVAPVVVAGESRALEGRHVLFHIDEVVRGEVSAGATIRVDLRQANRERSFSIHPRALQLDENVDYLLLLEPSLDRDAREGDFDLVRGVRGARELPAEGSERVLSALRRFAAVQSVAEDAHTWSEFSRMLEDPNPILVRTALGQFVRFRRASAELLPSLQPLLFHPGEDVRESAARVVGQVLERDSTTEAQRAAVQSDLVSRARRDPSIAVRVAATEALDAVQDPAVGDVLREIADEDPDQNVRYAAERLLYERERSRAARAGGAGGPD